MKYLHRELEKQVAQAARHFPAVVLTGPRRAGKTSLLRRLFPQANYFLLEDPDVVAVPRLEFDMDTLARRLSVDFDAVLLDGSIASVSLPSDVPEGVYTTLLGDPFVTVGGDYIVSS